ncbi:MAG TPA: glycoside hydrolase family 127 protein [Candidatus Hydrogenedentes bacterium]|nr:glycoside hydrolase family 127 protein [Candidatus Hydrogenedentota bacterium]HPC17180.1 glycoside hydrolase family 127 protein [Candidatus Hydrogenedentota bacterium]HRT20482.1 glycoside hydrolase family 127 protein [Candidatus Hydrogenedentota bacterium]HRT65183.1 glycoside hydrolase family 127 protein [Candidatus Hydrogenedentota bacterium]
MSILLGLSALPVLFSFAAAEPLAPTPFTSVKLDGGFWTAWIELNRTHVLPHCFDQCEKAGKINNFLKAAGRLQGEHEGAPWEDSDVYKVLEGAAYCLAFERDPTIEKTADDLIEKIAAAQRPDGYLHTHFQLRGIEKRWTDDSAHETYCAGHLIEAGIAYFQATGKRDLLDVAIRFADHIDSVFGPGKLVDVPQHEEIELALVKLWRITNEDRYLKLAQFFVEERGRMDTRRTGPDGKPRSWGETCQDHKPVREQSEIVGHAVRAMYLFSGVADLAAITGDAGFRDALERIWTNTTQRKMYITGGLGSTARHEGFTGGYDLPNESAYCETCAAIAFVFMNHRMGLIAGESRFADIVERAMYNGALSGVSLDGRHFFYVNPLASAGQHHRAPWHGCACCPTNIVRFLPSIAGYAYAHRGREIFVNQFMPGRATIRDGENELTLSMATKYPWDGDIRLTIEPKGSGDWTLRLRIPGWRRPPVPGDLYTPVPSIPSHEPPAILKINGQDTPLAMDNGYARIARKWKPGDTIELSLPMPIMRMKAHPNVKADVGRVALQRGPIVYCVEGIDHGGDVRQLALPADAPLNAEWRPDLLNGVMTIVGKAQARTESGAASVSFQAVPYYAWDNREQGPMAVWLPETIELAQAVPPPTMASESKVTASFQNRDSILAVKDRIEPKSSNDHSIPRMTWWDHLGTREWIQYTFKEAQQVKAVEVYWFDDTGTGQCRVPKSWRILHADKGQWKEVDQPSAYTLHLNTYNRTTFNPVKTDALRIEVELQPGFSGGILEWRVE